MFGGTGGDRRRDFPNNDGSVFTNGCKNKAKHTKRSD
jgi:hypothetical protein